MWRESRLTVRTSGKRKRLKRIRGKADNRNPDHLVPLRSLNTMLNPLPSPVTSQTFLLSVTPTK